MGQRQRGGPQLPKELRSQLGDPVHHRKSNRPRNSQSLNRKDRRKAERNAKKALKRQSTNVTIGRNRQPKGEPESCSDSDVVWSDNPPPSPPSQRNTQAPLKGIMKRGTKVDTQAPGRMAASPSPPPKVSRAVKDRLAQDDAEIAALEKKLGIKGKNRHNDLGDGLGDIFGDLGGFGSDEDPVSSKAAKRKRDQDDEWLAGKRRKALGNSVEEAHDEEFDTEYLDVDMDGREFDEGSDEEYVVHEDSERERSEGEDDIWAGIENEGSGSEGFSSEADELQIAPRARENPYIPPTALGLVQSGKYIPPALRAPPSSDTQALARLKRQIQGLVNRLSDANMMTILRDVEKLYRDNPRGYVTTILVDLLINLLADETTLLDTFIILHAGFIAAIYRTVGLDFGAQLVERIVAEFDMHYQRNKEGSGKQTTNLISTIAELYCFQVIGSNLAFDYVKQFLDELSEINTELLLRIIRLSGPQLRQDDPSSLKDIVLLLQKSVAKVGQGNLPVRTKFMIETINDLKNNRMKTGAAASMVTSEHTVKMKKQLGTLSGRNLKGTEPLRIGLVDIRNTEKKGKWWLVGASWRNDAGGEAAMPDSETAPKVDLDAFDGQEQSGDVDLFQLAREQRMNTDVRRAIFITIMSASDCKEAHLRLLKLNLKKAQEMEIPRVIIHCAGSETAYNPYYTVLARKFCSDHRSRKCFQFALWDIFKALGETKDDDDAKDEDEDDVADADLSLRRLVNLGKLYGTLIAKGDLSVTSLKPLNFPYLKPKTKTLVEVLLVTVILESQKGKKEKRNEKALLNIFINADAAPEMVTGLQYLLKKVISKTEITANEGEQATVRRACRVVTGMLERLMAATTLEEDG